MKMHPTVPFSRKKIPQNMVRLSFANLKKQCKLNGITNTVLYKERYKEFPEFPAHPERAYQYEWVGA